MNLQPINPYNKIEELKEERIQLKENNKEIVSETNEVLNERVDNSGDGQNNK